MDYGLALDSENPIYYDFEVIKKELVRMIVR